MSILKSLNEKEWSLIAGIASEISLKKEGVIFRKGDRCDKEVFVKKGIVRGFLVDEEGNEKSTSFFQEGEFMSTRTLRTENGFSMYNYQALCTSELLVFDSNELKALLAATKKMMELGKEIKQRELTRVRNRDECLMQVKAADKYLKFVKFYPDLEKQISQRHIASYLGITPVSLSRLKSTRHP